MFHWLGRKLFNKFTLVLLIVGTIGGATYVLGWSSLLTVEKVIVVGAPTKADAKSIEGQISIGEKWQGSIREQ
ncbi:MAG: hypothetical protein WDO06_10115 [Actinomycetota bacterium]